MALSVLFCLQSWQETIATTLTRHDELDRQPPVTGGYDHICKVWDMRSKAATLSLDHGAPIEALSYFPSGEACNRVRGWNTRLR